MSQTNHKASSHTDVSETLQESLSGLMDGEISELELRRLLKANDGDFQVLRKKWSRYHSASAVNRSDDAVGFSTIDLSLAISSAIDEEPTYGEKSASAAKKSGVRQMWSGVGRFAVAASVAGAVVLGVQFSPSGLDNQIVDSDPVTLPSASSPSSFGQGIPSDTVVSTVSNEATSSLVNEQRAPITLNEDTKEQLKQAEEQVNRLMLEHAQNASQNTQQGVLPYARVPENSAE
ncbi:sigma-E factor negative regulatory protein [Eionea flava]